MDWVQKLQAHACTRSGADDSSWYQKFGGECRELTEYMHSRDLVGCVLELADLHYYLAKALYRGSMTELQVQNFIQVTITFVGLVFGFDLSFGLVAEIAVAKYASRAEFRKDDARERAVAADLLRRAGIEV